MAVGPAVWLCLRLVLYMLMMKCHVIFCNYFGASRAKTPQQAASDEGERWNVYTTL